jgi:hypothetical protein
VIHCQQAQRVTPQFIVFARFPSHEGGSCASGKPSRFCEDPFELTPSLSAHDAPLSVRAP